MKAKSNTVTIFTSFKQNIKQISCECTYLITNLLYVTTLDIKSFTWFLKREITLLRSRDVCSKSFKCFALSESSLTVGDNNWSWRRMCFRLGNKHKQIKTKDITLKCFQVLKICRIMIKKGRFMNLERKSEITSLEERNTSLNDSVQLLKNKEYWSKVSSNFQFVKVCKSQIWPDCN